MDREITITKAEGTWVVRARGATLGETSNALRLSEEGHAPVIYFPREDFEMLFLEKSAHTKHCPGKGDATYYDLVAKSGTVRNAVWSYEDPIESVAAIKDYLAFDLEQVDLEQI